jgi:DNA-binding Lrp family transcriptional regulator
LPLAREGEGMGGRVLALDVVLSAVFFFAGKWTPALKRNQSRDLLRFLLCRLYDQGRGNLGRAQLTLAQGTIAWKLGLSRQWVGELLDRLQDASWIELYAPVLDDGMRGSTIFRVGRQLKRLLVMLLKSKRRKTPARSDANKAWQFSPSKEEKRHLQILEQENTPPKPEILKRIPLLKQWLERGQKEMKAKSA